MTTPSLVSAQPWHHEDARAGLLDRATSTRGRIGGVEVGVILEPLLARVDGRAVQSIRLVLPDEDAARLAAGSLAIEVDGERTDLRITPLGAGELRVLVARVDVATPALLRLPAIGEDALEFELLPQREWTVHVVHHSHFDFGYTDPQAAVFASQRSYLDSALDLIERTADWPEEARFRWNAEALWAITDWMAHRPAAQVDRLLAAVRAGSIGLSALPYNLHTDVCSTDELHELLRSARRLRDEHGVEFVSAMQTDVPGQVAGLPDALAELGVRYLSVAHNWAGRSQPHTNGGLDLPRLFRWRTPAGREVTVWMTDSPHGLAYMEGPMLGFSEDYASVERYLPAYLTALATRGYPFPAGIFGAHGETTEREPYPWEVLHLRTQGTMGDNGPARLLLSTIVREWNETWESPRLRVSRNEDFFRDVEQRHGDALPEFEGDWGDWWVEGVGSAAVPMSLLRQAQARVTDARSLSQLARWSGGDAVDDEAAAAERIYDAVSMFNEHTWGAGNSWLHSDRGFDSGELQWRWKVAQALIAHQLAADAVEKGLAHLGQTARPTESTAASYLVANTTGRVRSGAVRFLLPESLVALDHGIELRDARSGESVPFVEEAQQNSNHREAGRWVTARVTAVPAFGTVRLDVTDRGPDAPAAHPNAASPEASRRELLTLENEYLRVVVDEHRSAIASIVELATGRELVREDAVVGFNGYVYDEYGSSGAGVNHLANKLSTSGRLELLAGRSVGEPSRIVERSDDPLESRLVYEFAAAGADRVRVTLRLRRGEPWLLIENRVAKPSRRLKESGYFAFPFAGDDARMRFEVSGGVTGDDLPHVPGAPRHMRAVRDWVTVETGEGSAAWVTRDAPLVQPHAIALPYAPFPDSTAPREPGTVYSWFHNNLWDTNFPIEQGFEADFHYAVGVTREPGSGATAIALETADELVRPLLAARATGGGPRGLEDGGLEHGGPELGGPELGGPELGGLELSDARVRLVAVLGEGAGTLVRLQSFADEPVALRVALNRPAVRARRAGYLGDPGDELTAGATIELPLAPFEATALLLEF